MFPHDQRLHTTSTILTVYRQGKRRGHGCVSCYFLAKPGSLGSVAVVVDSKVARKAVVRNLLRRQVRSILQERGLPEGKLIVRLQKGAPDCSFDTLKDSVTKCLSALTHSS